MKTKLLSLLALALLLSGCGTPQDYAEAARIKEQARVEAERQSIANDAERTRQEVLAPVSAELEATRRRATQDLQLREEVAQLELKYKQLEAELKLTYQQKLDEAEANHQKTLAQIETDRQQAETAALTTLFEGVRDSLIAIFVASGAAGLLILSGWGIGHGIRAYARNKGESVYPKNGQWPAIVRPDGIYLPGRVPGSYMLLGRPGLLERMAQTVAYLVHVKRGQIAPPPNNEGWVRLPGLAPEQLQITTNDQSTNMLAAATHGTAKTDVQSVAAEGAANVARTVFGVNIAQLPAPRTVVVQPDDLRRLDSAGGRLEDDR